MDLLNVEQVLQICQCSSDGLKLRIRERRFPAGIIIGKHRRWLGAEVAAWRAGYAEGVRGEALVQLSANIVARRESLLQQYSAIDLIKAL